MYYETDKNDHGLRYNPLKACVVPRPIGWITTISAAGVVNLAPFSFFNLLSYDPPFVMFSAGSHEEDGGKKDTVVNVEATGEFVYSMATWAQKDQMNQTGAHRRARRRRDGGGRARTAAVAPGAPAARQGLARPLRVPAAPDRDTARPQAVVGASRRHRPRRGRAHRRCGADHRRPGRHRSRSGRSPGWATRTTPASRRSSRCRSGRRRICWAHVRSVRRATQSS